MMHLGLNHRRFNIIIIYNARQFTCAVGLSTMHFISFDIGIRNLAFCVAEVQNNEHNQLTLHRWENVDLNARKGVPILDALLDVLDDITFGENSNFGNGPVTVVVENQPSKGRKMMSVIQVFIESFFRIMTRYHGDSKRFKVVAISPKIKNRNFVISGGGFENEGKKSRNAKYRFNKRQSIATVSKLLSDQLLLDNASSNYSKYFCEAPPRKKNTIKLDDLADCALQLYAYVYK